MVSGLIFRSLIYFEFVFIYGVRKCSNFIPLYVAVPFSQYHLLKKLYFLLCHRLIDHVCVWVYFWALSLVLLIYVSVASLAFF